MIFVSFDSQDRNWVSLLVQALRSRNPSTDIFWTGDPLPSGLGWFQFIERSIQECAGIISVLTNNSTGTNNWINFEAGAAVGRNIGRMIIYGPDITIASDVSRPLQNIQLVCWSNRQALTDGLARLALDSSPEAVEAIWQVFSPFRIEHIRYGIPGAEYAFSPQERQAFFYEIQSRKQIIIGNHLIGNRDPGEGIHKTIHLEIIRNNRRYHLAFEEEAMVRCSDLYQ